ncbi:MAG: hypothetical protein J6125_01350 [Clostridia bacterium]|nr:hypothetical protein [Clostridia bacterium]
MKDNRPRFRFGLMIAAIIFLCNPNVNLIDPLPDFFGYLFLALSLSDAEVAFPYFSEARSGFFKVMWISLSKIPAALLMLSIWSRDYSQKSIIPVFTLSYAFVELVFLIPAVSAFFEGVFYLGTRFDCECVLKTPKNLGSLTAEGVTRVTLIFLLIKGIMGTLPEFSLASVRQYSPDAVMTGGRVVASSLYPLLLLAGAMIVLILGISWASILIRWLRYLARDGGMDRLLREHLLAKADVLATRRRLGRVAAALTVLTVGVGCGIDLVFDDVNMLPDVLSAVMFVVGLRLLLPFCKKAKIAIPLFSVYGAVSFAAYVMKVVWVERYAVHGRAVPEAGIRLFLAFEIVSAVEAALLIAAVLSLAPVLAQAWRSFGRGDPSMPHDQPADAPLPRTIRRRLVGFATVGVLQALLTFAGVLLSTQSEMKMIVNTGANVPQAYRVFVATVPKWGWFWLVPLCFSLVWLVYALTVIGGLRDNVRDTMELS